MSIDSHPVYHLSSHARAGETVFLRSCDAHPRIHVPLQITDSEDPEAQDFIAFVRDQEPQSVDNESHPYVTRLDPGAVVLVKQGVWSPDRFRGFGLVRQPLAFVASMLAYNHREGLSSGFTEKGRYRKTYERLTRWSKAMDRDLFRAISKERHVIRALCRFYNWRVQWILQQNETVLRYEHFVADPETALREACRCMGLDLEPSMLSAHESHVGGAQGHGMNDLSRPLDTASLTKWREQLSTAQVDLVLSCSGELAEQIGYDLP